jgi:hypothetical protein
LGIKPKKFYKIGPGISHIMKKTNTTAMIATAVTTGITVAKPFVTFSLMTGLFDLYSLPLQCFTDSLIFVEAARSLPFEGCTVGFQPAQTF